MPGEMRGTGGAYASGVKRTQKKTAEVVEQILERVEQKLSEGEVKATLGDYIRLVQLQKELEEEEPGEITVRWVDPEEPDGAGRRRNIEYRPLPSQRKFHDSAARFKGFSGPIGSGKSQALCHEAIKLSYLNPGRTGLIGAPTYPMLRDATAAALLEVLERNKIPHEVNRAENFVLIRETRSKILFRAVEEFERLRGSNLAWFGVDELTYTAEQAWLRLEGRLRDPKAGAVRRVRGMDPERIRLGVREVRGAEDRRLRDGDRRLRWRTGYLLERVPDYYERLRGSYDERFFQQEALGQYVSLHAGRVYPRSSGTGTWRRAELEPDAAAAVGSGFQLRSHEFGGGAEGRGQGEGAGRDRAEEGDDAGRRARSSSGVIRSMRRG